MKLERLHEYVMVTVVLLAGSALAFFCAKLSGSGDTSVLGVILLALLLGFIAISARERIWIAIPICWVWSGRILVLPIPMAARDIVVFSVFGMFLVYKALKLVRLRPPVDSITLLIAVNLLYLATVFVRNPVGIAAVSSERVGGRAYFTVAVSVAAFWVLCRARATAGQARVLPFWMVVSAALQAGIATLCSYSLRLATLLGGLYENFAVDSRLTEHELTGEIGSGLERNTNLSTPAFVAFDALCAHFRPLTLIHPLYPLRCLALLVTVIAVFASGFRSVMIYGFLAFLLSSYLRRGALEVARIAALLVPILAVLVVAQGNLLHLPFSMQRALSFLPGNWDWQAREDAETSTAWRTGMWREALGTNLYIENKLLGDGFGFSRSQFEQMEVLSAMPVITVEQTQETAMIAGNFHNGPITAIRVAGYVGLLLYLALILQMARIAFRLIREASGGPFQILALFIGIPVIISPFYFIVVFGNYAFDLPDAIVRGGLLRMLGNSIASLPSKVLPPAAPPLSPLSSPSRALPVPA